MLIFDDADVDNAIFRAALGIFVHSGQGCVCGSRVFAQRGVYDKVVEGLANLANPLPLGGPDDGPLFTALFTLAALLPVALYHHSWSVWLAFDHLVETLPRYAGRDAG